eukprot:EC792937.1.p2 GENE.EC792937.1~~EC792937.1.p2  ORF type:complete len:51 (-),score=0.76 EC792937.1:25-177(-)
MTTRAQVAHAFLPSTHITLQTLSALSLSLSVRVCAHCLRPFFCFAVDDGP